MASVSPYAAGYSLRWSYPTGQKWHVRLRGFGLQDAAEAAEHVATLARSAGSGRPVPYATTRWLQTAPKNLVEALAECGLHDSRRTISEAVDAFIDDNAKTLSNDRRADIERELDGFVRFIGGRVSVCEIVRADCERWLETRTDLKESTRLKYAAIISKFFRWAVAEKLAAKNPTEQWETRTFAAADRREVSAAEFDAVVAVVGDLEKAALGIARWGGLRAAEICNLRWGDVSFPECKLKVRETKRGDRVRAVPMCKELGVVLHQIRLATVLPGAAVAASAFVLTGGHATVSREVLTARIRAQTSLAGVPLWPRLFHNLRATRQTEWIAQFGIVDACLWIGNSTTIASKHYALATESNFKRATENG